MMQAIELLRKRLHDKYGTELGDIVSYVAPNMEIGDYGYEALDNRTNIRYVGVSYFPYENVTSRDFGWEKDLDIYNLPRIKGDFYEFNQPQYIQYNRIWMSLRSVIESGDAYLIFTHPDETELLINAGEFPDATLAGVFDGCKVWADFISQNYPFYRWWTSSEIGHYLEHREGFLNGEWLPATNTLKLRLAQPDDAIHIKTPLYLQSVTDEQGTLSLVFNTAPCNFQSTEYDVTKTAQDYYIYPMSERLTKPTILKAPFEYITPSERIPTSEETARLIPTIHNTLGEYEEAPGENGLSTPSLIGIMAAAVILTTGTWFAFKSSRKKSASM
jgi:hypothetical protein